MRTSFNVGTKVGPLYVGTRITPGRSPYGQNTGNPYQSPRTTPRTQDPRRAYQQNDPRTPRPSYSPAQHSAPRDAWRVARDVRADLANYRAAQAQATMRPSVATYGTRRPQRKPLAYYAVCALAVVVAGLVAMVVLGMVAMALHIAPAATPTGDNTPRPTATATHTAAHTARTTTGGAAR